MQPATLWFVLPLATAVSGTVLYHIAARQAPSSVSSAAVLLGAYGVGALLCGLALARGIDPGGQSGAARFHWSSLALGVAVVLIEFGFLWMYRVGWPISSGGLSVNILATIVLALVGWFVFHDRLSPTNLIGMIVCLVGLALLTYRSH